MPQLKFNHIPEDDLSKQIVDCAFQVHQQLGPGLLENAYEECLSILLAKNGIPFERQVSMPLFFENQKVDIGYRIDILVNDKFIVELKVVEKVLPIHEAQLLTYMKLSKKRIGFLMNFNTKLFKDGIRLFVL